MMQSILLVGLVALVPLVASSCCLPTQWEGKEGFMVGQVMHDGTTSLTQVCIKVFEIIHMIQYY